MNSLADKGARKGANATHAGWLHKKGGLNRSLKARYCVLRGGDGRRGGMLLYYESELATTPKGELNLLGAMSEAVLFGTKGRYAFEVTVLSQGAKGRTYEFEAADEASREEWLCKVQQASAAAPLEAGAPSRRDSASGDSASRLEHVVGLPPPRSWRDEWTALRLEQMRFEGNSEGATRQACGEGGSQSIERWATNRKEAVAWKLRNGWDEETAKAYTLITSNGAALARGVRERVPAYAASTHLVVGALASSVRRMECVSALVPPLLRLLPP